MVQPPPGAPAAVAQVIAAGNAIATLPYIWGGGHGSFQASGYDCSGSVSYALAAAGLLSSPLDSTGFESWGAPGPGRWITVYANADHAFMVVAGWRFDTVALAEGGTRWSQSMADTSGFVVRHPPGCSRRTDLHPATHRQAACRASRERRRGRGAHAMSRHRPEARQGSAPEPPRPGPRAAMPVAAAASAGVRLQPARRRRAGSTRVSSRTSAGIATIAIIARNQIWPASVPSPSAWTRPASQASAVKRWSLRQRTAPIARRA